MSAVYFFALLHVVIELDEEFHQIADSVARAHEVREDRLQRCLNLLQISHP